MEYSLSDTFRIVAESLRLQNDEALSRMDQRNKEIAKLRDAEKTVDCTICGNKTTMTGTKLCDRCWELKSRIEMDLDLAKKIIANLESA